MMDTAALMNKRSTFNENVLVDPLLKTNNSSKIMTLKVEILSFCSILVIL